MFTSTDNKWKRVLELDSKWALDELVPQEMVQRRRTKTRWVHGGWLQSDGGRGKDETPQSKKRFVCLFVYLSVLYVGNFSFTKAHPAFLLQGSSAGIPLLQDACQASKHFVSFPWHFACICYLSSKERGTVVVHYLGQWHITIIWPVSGPRPRDQESSAVTKDLIANRPFLSVSQQAKWLSLPLPHPYTKSMLTMELITTYLIPRILPGSNRVVWHHKRMLRRIFCDQERQEWLHRGMGEYNYIRHSSVLGWHAVEISKQQSAWWVPLLGHSDHLQWRRVRSKLF